MPLWRKEERQRYTALIVGEGYRPGFVDLELIGTFGEGASTFLFVQCLWMSGRKGERWGREKYGEIKNRERGIKEGMAGVMHVGMG